MDTFKNVKVLDVESRTEMKKYMKLKNTTTQSIKEKKTLRKGG